MSNPTPDSAPGQRRDDADASLPKLLERLFGPPSLGWANTPEDIRQIVNLSPLVLLFPLVLACPAGTYSINGQPATRAEFLSVVGPFVAAVVLLTAIVVYAIWTERRWVRELSVLVALAPAAQQMWAHEFHLPLLMWLLLALPVCGDIYFWYFRRDVAAYYRLLRMRDDGPSLAPRA